MFWNRQTALITGGSRGLGLALGREIADGLLAGMHSPGESHFELLQSFLDRERFAEAERIAEAADFLAHEFGDATLLLPDRAR